MSSSTSSAPPIETAPWLLVGLSATAAGAPSSTLAERRASNLPRVLALLAETVREWEGAPDAPVIVGARNYLAGVEAGRPARLVEVLAGLRGLTARVRRADRVGTMTAADVAWRRCRACADSPARRLRANLCESCRRELGLDRAAAARASAAGVNHQPCDEPVPGELGRQEQA